MLLLQYLKDNYPTFTDTELTAKFLEDFGVDVSVEDDLYLFKYNQILVKWSPMVEECRGIILRHTSDWEVVSLPHNKFYNFSEQRCSLKELTGTEKFVEKADGTCIQVWYDSVQNRWRASTLGTISPLQFNGSGPTFDQLFWKVSGLCPAILPFGQTHLFELCSIFNAIVNIYPTDRCYYHGSRSLRTGEYLDAYEIVKSESILKPKEFDFSGLTQAQILEQIENIPSGELGSVPEGCVVYVANRPVAKLKRRDYLSKHGIMTGNPRHVAKCLVELFFIGGLDDVYSTLHDSHKNFTERLSAKVSKWSADAIRLAPLFSLETTRKDHAEQVKLLKHEEIVSRFPEFFFKRERYVCGPNSFTQFLTDKQNHAGQFSDDYKYNFEHVLDELKNLYFEGAIDGKSERRSPPGT